MTNATEAELLPVTQADRDAARQLCDYAGFKWSADHLDMALEASVQAFARHRLAHTAPAEPVLRWEGDKLWLGEHYAGAVGALDDGRWYAEVRLGWETTFHDTREDATAWVEQAVRDWLARAGLTNPPAAPSAEVVELVEAAQAVVENTYVGKHGQNVSERSKYGNYEAKYYHRLRTALAKVQKP